MKDGCCSTGESCSTSLRSGLFPFIGRLLISSIFILSGIMKILYFKETALALQAVGLTTATNWLLFGALLCEVVGGLMILLGWYTRIGAVILMIFLIPTTFLFHNFWAFQDHSQAEQLAHFLKNLAIYGGLFLLLAYGPGRWSFDECCCKK